jgi:biopolymer transport protein ExbD
MRRFSQKNHLVTLSEINITPLLDLAFVLLIIFVITTPLLENSIDLRLPTGGQPPKEMVDPRKIRTIEVEPRGRGYKLNRTTMTLTQIGQSLSADFKLNPNLVVSLRADRHGEYGWATDVINVAQKAGIKLFSLQTEPEK